MMPDKVARNPFTGVEIIPRFDSDGGIESLIERQPVDGPKLGLKLQTEINEAQRGRRPHSQRHLQHIAEIPNVIVNDLMRRGIWQDAKKLKRWLDSEGSAFKTVPGRLS